MDAKGEAELAMVMHGLERAHADCGSGPCLHPTYPLTHREAMLLLEHTGLLFAFGLAPGREAEALIEQRRIAQALAIKCPWMVLRGAVYYGSAVVPAEPDIRAAVEGTP